MSSIEFSEKEDRPTQNSVLSGSGSSKSEIPSHNLKSYEDISSDEEEEYISSEELVEKLQELIAKVKRKTYTDVTRQDISDSIEEYISGKDLKPFDVEAISYLFRGWWVTDALRRVQNPDLKDGQTLPPLENCPFCLKKMESTYETNIPKEEPTDK